MSEIAVLPARFIGLEVDTRLNSPKLTFRASYKAFGPAFVEDIESDVITSVPKDFPDLQRVMNGEVDFEVVVRTVERVEQ